MLKTPRPSSVAGAAFTALLGLCASRYSSLPAQAQTATKAKAAASKQANTTDLTGTWEHQRSGGRTDGIVKGTFQLARTPPLDADGFIVWSGKNQGADGVLDGKTAMAGVKGDVIQVCIDGYSLPCVGSRLNDDEIVAKCSFLGYDAGEFRAKRVSRITPPK